MNHMPIRAGLFLLGISIGIGVSAQTRIERTSTARFDTATLRPSRETVFQAMRERSLIGMKREPERLSIGRSTLFELIRSAGIKAGVNSLGLVLVEHQQIPSTRVVVEHVERNPTEK